MGSSSNRSAHLGPIVAAIADLDGGELAALIDATNEVPQIAPSLLAWIEHAVDWERHRRAGINFTVQPPEAAIPHEEDAVSIDAAVIIRSQFAQDHRTKCRGVAVLFDAMIVVLSRGERNH